MSYGKNIGASLIALGMAFATPAMAANAPAKPAAPSVEAAATPDFTDAQLASYKAANKKVEELNKQYTQRAAGAADGTAKQQVEQLKNIDLADAVKSSGLTTAEYNQIYMATKADPTLAAKIASMKDPVEPATKIQ